jgi:hypothetical protein
MVVSDGNQGAFALFHRTWNLRSRRSVGIRLVIVQWQRIKNIAASIATMQVTAWNYPATVGILGVQRNSNTGAEGVFALYLQLQIVPRVDDFFDDGEKLEHGSRQPIGARRQHLIARRKGLQSFPGSLRSPVRIGGMFWLH